MISWVNALASPETSTSLGPAAPEPFLVLVVCSLIEPPDPPRMLLRVGLTRSGEDLLSPTRPPVGLSTYLSVPTQSWPFWLRTSFSGTTRFYRVYACDKLRKRGGEGDGR